MRVLVACEFSGKVRDAFIRKGHPAYSCDILPGEGEFNSFHIQDDILKVIKTRAKDFDLMIAHPPCTYLANSGVRWLYTQAGRMNKMIQGAEFFKKLLHVDIDKICIENPTMHYHALNIIEAKADQIIQPWQFGHGETKATCLWLSNLPKLTPTNIVEGREGRIWKMPPSADRQKLRSVTYQGIANAMAEQWGG